MLKMGKKKQNKNSKSDSKTLFGKLMEKPFKAHEHKIGIKKNCHLVGYTQNSTQDIFTYTRISCSYTH